MADHGLLSLYTMSRYIDVSKMAPGLLCKQETNNYGVVLNLDHESLISKEKEENYKVDLRLL